MITVICSSKNPSDEFKKHLVDSSGLKNKIEVLIYENKGEFSLTEIYNRGLSEAKNRYVVFCHDDITIETNQWGPKLIKIFNRNPEYTILGVAGSKELSETGRWWDNPKKMYGKVSHTHEGKTWLSSYSNDLGQTIEEVVVCDGVWFAVDTLDNQFVPFDETIKGFHFYDVGFSFNNHLNGNKVGITTQIRINHQSIGETNDSWEENRKIFIEKYKDSLPTILKRTLRKNEKLKVLIGCLNFTNLTGSEIYVYELAKGLIKKGCDVTVVSTIGNPMVKLANIAGIKTASIQEPPGYKLGDGSWLIKRDGVETVSRKNVLYNIQKTNFDIIHLNHKPITEHLLNLYPDVPAICTIHSEIIPVEEPVINENIKKYIAIRPVIKELLENKFEIPSDKIEIIYNLIDANRFKPSKINKVKNRTLFVGTIDTLRKNMILDLVKTTKENGKELYIVGKNNDNYLEELINNNPHVSYFPPLFNVEKMVQECDETAGIMLGRTTIEGWMCGKKGWIYDVDSNGVILSKKLFDIPNDVNKFDSLNVVEKIMDEYIKIIE